MKRFKRGEQFYKETSIGGCTNSGECKQSALKILDVDCISNCVNLVGNMPKLETVIKAQAKFLDSIDPYTVEYRTEKSDLDILIAARNKALADNIVFSGVA